MKIRMRWVMFCIGAPFLDLVRPISVTMTVWLAAAMILLAINDASNSENGAP